MCVRDLRLLVAAALLCPAVGCNWMREWRDQVGQPRPTPGGRLPDRPASEFVRFVNQRADALQSVEYSDVRMRVSGKGIPISVSLEGNLAAAQPRCFRLIAGGKMAGKIDLGSNPEQFWVYTGGAGEPLFVYASHSDFESGRAKIPGGMPFEPDWVMQALGMTKLPEGGQYDVKVDDRERTYTLGWNAVAPNGVPVRKEIVFDGEPATGNRSQVKRHVLRDAKRAAIATAEIRSAETIAAGVTADGKRAVTQYPTRLVLKWEEPKFEMDMTLDRGTANAEQAADRRAVLFSRPTNLGTPAIDLAGARFDAPTGRPR
ncbi:hypothetical protein [Urbifossiella limnaea]|uniref:DUF4292 domain-containing protein n=1 Tax=Urbifossiella limnaea TaxID=2528023 RepID=A0A517XM16_9BACT|nr:hypothetical protein [Urbifossiella limnaea]QDU18555.1 hypothetical protein ETAA1_04470 [Urbifossiella limnaea]